MKKKVAVAISGGVDSAVAAALLIKQGCQVVGLTMDFGGHGKSPGSCGGTSVVLDSRRVAENLGIRHYVLDLGDELERHVIADFVREYSLGRTPNPCVRCNELLKFGILLKKSAELGMDFLATGHYVRLGRRNSFLSLKKSADGRKDQSYFLYRLKQEQLKRVLFPLGNYDKDAVRGLSREFGLPVAEKKDSQEICFIPVDTREFLGRRIAVKPGEIVDSAGNVLGRHEGIHFFTVGQRKGLSIGTEKAYYVSRVDARRNRVIAGSREEAYASSCLIEDCVFPNGFTGGRFSVRVRYLAAPARAQVSREGNRARIDFDRPQFAVTPGQSAVIYDRGFVLGGGLIVDAVRKPL